jgi:hypothetical protein
VSGAGESGRGAGRGSPLGDEALVAALGQASREVAASDGQAEPPPSVWHALARRSARPSRPAGLWGRRSRLWPLVLGLSLAAIAVLGAVRWRDGRRAGWSVGGAHHRFSDPGVSGPGASGAPLTFAVAGAPLRSGDEIDAAGHSNAKVRFSDGTDIGLDEGARLTVAGRSPEGARLRLRGGRAHFQVVHRPRAAWTVEAGPYLIEVTGTIFDVRWSEAEQTIEVRMHSGSVRVSGPLLSERMPLRTGQRLVARPVDGDVRLEQARVEDRLDDRLEDRLDDERVPGKSTGDDGAEAPAAPEPSAARGPRSGGLGSEPRATGPALDQTAGVPVRSGESGLAVSPAAAAPRRPRVWARLALAREPLAAAMPPGEPARDPVRPDRIASGNPAWQPEPLPSLDAPAGPTAPAPVAGEALPGSSGDGGDAPAVATAHAETSPSWWRQRRWSAKVAAGDSQAVIAEAESIGMDATLSSADSQTLAALADAARYARRPDLADKALIEERRRFPGGGRAQAAAFLLGRAADDRGDIQGGLAWYHRYLAEAPAGPYAAEALGREMLAIERLQGRGAAVPLAEEYLRRFPNGTYLLRARALLHDR